MHGSVAIAFLLTLIAGLATGAGSAIAFFAKRTNTKLLSGSLGFSAGVMVYISFVEIFAKSLISLSDSFGSQCGAWATVGAFFGGILLIGVIDKLIPEYENPHEPHGVEDMQGQPKRLKSQHLFRTGVFVALALAIHNFPEGLVTFATALKSTKLAVPIAIAIAIHNIPEGIAVSVPIFYATGSRSKAFTLSFLSGLAEPAGALIGYFLFLRYISPEYFGLIFAAVGGITVFISFDELLPAAHRFGHHHYAIYGLVAGMAVMAISLLLII
jgi:ZIP family zinc transporter